MSRPAPAYRALSADRRKGILVVLLLLLLALLSPPLALPGQAAQATSGQGILVLPFVNDSAAVADLGVGFALAATLETLHNKIPTLPESYLAHQLATLAVTPDELIAAYAAEGERRGIPERTVAAWATASDRRLVVSGSYRLQGDRLRVEVTVYDASTGGHRQHQLQGTFSSELVDLKREWLTVLDHYLPLALEIRPRLLNPETRSVEAFRRNGRGLRHWLAYIRDRQLALECREALLAARQAVAADGRYALALDTLAYILWWRNDKAEASRLFAQALARDPFLMDAMDGQVGLLFAGGREEEARDLARRKGGLRGEEMAGERSRIAAQLADVAFKEGRLAEQGGGWQQALAWYEKGLALIGPERTAAPAAEGLAFRRAVAKAALGREGEAVVEFRELLARSRQLYGECGSAEQGALLQELGDLLLAQGRGGEALGEYRASLACREARADAGQRPLADSYGRIAAVLMQNADYPGAATLLRQARAILVRELGAGHPATGGIDNTLGVLSSQLGRPGEALSWYQKALAITLRHQGPEHGDTAALHNNMGLALCAMAEYGRARDAFGKALDIYRALGKEEDHEVAAVRANQGLLSYLLADFGTARASFEEALTIRLRLPGPERRETAEAYHNLGAVLQALDLPGQALANEELALAIRERLLPASHPDLAESHNALGAMRFRLGEYDAARALHQKALAITLQAPGPLHPEAALAYYNLGVVAVARHDYGQALAQFGQALPLAEQAGDRELRWRLYRELSRVDRGRGRPLTAIFWGKLAVNAIQAMRRQSVDLGRTLRKSFLADKEASYRELALLLEEEGRFGEAIHVIDLLKDEEYFDFIRRDQEEAAEGGQLPYSRAEQGWLAEYEACRRQSTAMRGTGDLAVASGTLVALWAALGQDRVGKTATGGGGLPVWPGQGRLDSLAQTLAGSKAGTVALYYLLTGHGLSILLVTPDRQLVRQVEIEADRLRDLIQRFRLRLTSPGSDPRPEAGRLYRILIAPVAEALTTAGARQLLLVTDGSLRYLPFAALHDGRGYLAERYTFSLWTSAPPAAGPEQGGRDLKVAALGVSEGGEGFSPLPSVREELDWIVKEGAADPVGVLPGVVRLNKAFNPAALVEALGQGFPAIHLASHFVSRPGTAADSYLLLGDGSHLDLDQIRQQRLDLRAVDLLTLSACDTALGQTAANGRELESLAVLLQRQGAKAVLASLWPVADHSTALFMQILYASLQQPGLAPETALGKAQHTLLASGSATSHPYFWAPFVLMGDWRR